MRSLALLALAAIPSIASAQITLSTLTGGTNQGNVGNMIWFDLQVNTTVTINQLTMLCGGNTVAGTTANLEVYLGPSTYVGNTLNPGLWTVAASTGPTLTVNPSTFLTANLPVPLCLGPGNYGVGLRSYAFNHGYTNGAGNNGSLVCGATPGSCLNTIFTTTEMTLRGGANQNTPFTSGLNQPRMWNGTITYTLGGVPSAIASWQKYGKGCYSWYHSFYETYLNPSTSFDVKNTASLFNSLRLTFAGTGYVVSPFNNGTGTFYAPTAAATNLNLLNASSAPVNLPWAIPYPMPTGPSVTTSVQVFDNGCITPATTPQTVPGSPTVATFLAGMPRWCPCWFDFDPSLNTSTGSISYEADPNGTAAYITWSNIPDVGIAASSNTFQCAFFATGDVEYRWGTMSLAQGGTYPALVGWTPGGGLANPGDIDISALATPFTTGPTDNPPLDLALSARPQLGTTPGFITSNIPAGTVLGALLIGFVQINPGIDLGFLGAPDCRQYVDLNTSISNVFFASGASTTFNFAIPNLPGFNGVQLVSQSATFTNGYNTLGVIMSNGARMTVGTL